MATVEQTRVLSTPKVLIDGRIIKVIPNTVEVAFGGAGKVRAVSSGGDSVEIVHGVNAEEFKAHIKLSVANTAEMSQLVRQLRDNANHDIPCTIRIVEQTDQLAFDTMFLINKPPVKYAAEGSIDLEFEGKHVP